MGVGLVHQVTIERATAGPPDDYNQPSEVWAPIGTSPGLVQPKGAEEVAQLNQGGVVKSDHSIYLPAATDVGEADRLVYAGETYQIDGIERRAYGKLHHLKINAVKITA